MPIVYRCEHCNQLMSISSKKAGQMLPCARCQQETRVPTGDDSPGDPVAEQEELSFQEDIADELDPLEEMEYVEERVNQDQPDSDGLQRGTAESPEPTLSAVSDDHEEEDEEFTIRSVQSDFEEMDLTPMVDVTFLLLIFFMVTASFSIEKSFEVPAPDPDQEGAAQTVQPLDELDDQSILVEIDAQNRFYVESETVQDPRELPNLLAEVRTRDSKSEVIIKVDERSHHEAIVAAIDAAQEIGMQRIRWGVTSEE